MFPFILIAIIALLVLAKAIHIVPAQQRYVVLRLGKVHSVVGPGMVLLVPLIDTIGAKYDLGEQEIAVDDCFIRYRILDPRKAFENAADFNSSLTQSARTAMKGIPGRDLFARQAVVEKMNGIVSNFGVQVIGCEQK